jgi:hypothetical protein
VAPLILLAALLTFKKVANSSEINTPKKAALAH